MKQVSYPKLFSMPVADRIQLAKELLESVTDEVGDVVSAGDKRILRERLADDAANPKGGISWRTLVRRLNARARRKR